jgi:hypothetical protein
LQLPEITITGVGNGASGIALTIQITPFTDPVWL